MSVRSETPTSFFLVLSKAAFRTWGFPPPLLVVCALLVSFLRPARFVTACKGSKSVVALEAGESGKQSSYHVSSFWTSQFSYDGALQQATGTGASKSCGMSTGTDTRVFAGSSQCLLPARSHWRNFSPMNFSWRATTGLACTSNDRKNKNLVINSATSLAVATRRALCYY